MLRWQWSCEFSDEVVVAAANALEERFRLERLVVVATKLRSFANRFH
jgi:hypothetical protein